MPKVSRDYKTSYDQNVTAAICNEQIAKKSNTGKTSGVAKAKKVPLSKEYIIEHAQRRVDLFFYLLVYYHDKNIEIRLGGIVSQHGAGSNYRKKEYTEASHSSLLSSTYGLLCMATRTNPNARHEIVWPLSNHFYNSLNSTVELPTEVNDFDGILEGKISDTWQSRWREDALCLLNLVSKGTINPLQGLQRYFLIMENFFNSDKIQQDYKNSANEAKRLIYAFQYQGTFDSKWNLHTKEVVDEYVFMLLRLDEKEIADFKQNSKFKYEVFYRLQNEMISGRSPDNYGTKDGNEEYITLSNGMTTTYRP